MKIRSAEAIRPEKEYLRRLDDAIRSYAPADAEEIRQGVKEHIEEAVSTMGSEEVTLAEMSEVLERLGAPETYAQEAAFSEVENPTLAANPIPTPPPVNAGAQEQLNKDKIEWRNFLSNLWIAMMIGVIGIYVPIINLHIFSIASCTLILILLRSPIVLKSPLLQRCKGLNIAMLVIMCVLPFANLFTLATPRLRDLVGLFLEVPLLVLSLMFAWRLLSGLGQLMTGFGENSVAKSIYRARGLYLVCMLMLIPLLIVGSLIFMIITGESLDQEESRILLEFLFLFTLPFYWIIAWPFLLRPISKADSALNPI